MLRLRYCGTSLISVTAAVRRAVCKVDPVLADWIRYPCSIFLTVTQVLRLWHLIHSIAVRLAIVIVAGFFMSQLLCGQPHHLSMVMVMSCTCTVAAVPVVFTASSQPSMWICAYRVHLYGDVYSSPGLDMEQKQLLVVAFLGQANMLEEMSGHALAVSIPSSYLKADHRCIFCKQTSM